MAGHKQHDYHIIDPSPWPILAAFGVFTMLFGAVVWMDARVLSATHTHAASALLAALQTSELERRPWVLGGYGNVHHIR